jgi:hypothetical protein
MMIIDVQALGRAAGFPLRHAVPVALAALACGGLHAAQIAAAQAGAGAAAGLALFAALAVLFIAAAGFGRMALELPGKGVLGFAAGADEARFVWVMILILILLGTVIGTAFLCLAFMLGALALIGADRAGMTEQPEGFVNIFALFGTGEWIVAMVLLAAFAVFSLWMLARVAMAGPATLERGRVQVLSIWPLSTGRSPMIALTSLLAAAPGIAVMHALAAAPLPAVLLAFVQGVAGIVLLVAPLMALWSALYRKFNAIQMDSA